MICVKLILKMFSQLLSEFNLLKTFKNYIDHFCTLYVLSVILLASYYDIDR